MSSSFKRDPKLKANLISKDKHCSVNNLNLDDLGLSVQIKWFTSSCFANNTNLDPMFVVSVVTLSSSHRVIGNYNINFLPKLICWK